MKQFIVSLILVVSLLVGTVGMAFAQDYPQPGDSVSNAVVQNKATGANETATVIAYYYNQSGGDPVYTHSNIQIAPKAVREIKTDEEPLGDGFQGAAVLSSSHPLAAIVSIQNRNVPQSPSGRTQGAYNATSAPSPTLYFPSVWRFNAIVTRLSIQNTDTESADITLTFKKRDGSDAGSLNATIAGNGQRVFYLGNANDVPANLPADFQDGSVTVTSTNGRNLAGAAVVTYRNRSSAYQALSDINKNTTLYAPSHYRFIFNAPANWASLPNSAWTLFSALNLQNTSTTETANVTLTYTARGATTPSLVKEITIPPLSAAGLNTQNGGDYPASDFNDLSKAGGGLPDWDGSVLIESDQELVGTNITNWGVQGYAGATALSAPTEGKNILYLPAQYRLHYTANSGWSQWSAINLQNVGTTTVDEDDLIIQYIDQAGNTVATFTGAALNDATQGDGLGPNEAIGLNTRNGGDLPASAFNNFPTDNGRPNFIGGIYVSAPAGSQLVAIGNIVYSDRASVYNGVPQ
jgi:hypothetical protein